MAGLHTAHLLTVPVPKQNQTLTFLPFSLENQCIFVDN